jgi:hypothetical protein
MYSLCICQPTVVALLNSVTYFYIYHRQNTTAIFLSVDSALFFFQNRTKKKSFSVKLYNVSMENPITVLCDKYNLKVPYTRFSTSVLFINQLPLGP